MHGMLHLRTIIIDPGDEPAFLIVQLEIHCTVCGNRSIELAGHHLKPILELLKNVVDDVDPALVDGGEETTYPLPPGSARRDH